MTQVLPKIYHPQTHELEVISRIISKKLTMGDHLKKYLYKTPMVVTQRGAYLFH